MLLNVCCFLLMVHIAVGLMCYQCKDSSNEKGKNDCQTYVRTMRYYRKKYSETGKLNKYVKNCTSFRENPDSPVYCMVASVELGGGVRSYIRDCSDGKSFFGASYNIKFDDILPDNQTKCIYTGQGYVACVTVCGENNVPGIETKFGDFCNGPLSNAKDVKGSFILFFTMLLIVFIL